MNFFFPENNNGSRIVVTTRLSEVVDYFSSSAVALSFLDDSKSWELFCEKTFPRESCPLELEDIGKKIVNKCKGLPLAIVVIGGLLGKSSRTQEYWEKIGNDISLILNSREGNKVLSILYLSYKHLPACLKSCFLYLGLFPEDYDIRMSELIKLWVAEGFIKPNTHQSLEEIAEGYVKELIDRSLLLVRGFRPHKRFETCCVHDLVRDLSIKIAAKEDFVCVQRDEDGRRHFTVDERSASFYRQNSSSGFMLRPPSLVHPQIFTAKERVPFKSRLLRVLAHCSGSLDYSLRDVSLRYLYHESTLVGHNRIRSYNLPSSISNLWSLQTLKITGIVKVVAPTEIWEMPQLRHVDIGSLHLPHPRGNRDSIVLRNLQTLGRVKQFQCSKEVCKRIPNIKELEFDSSSRCTLYNIGSLTKLESLRYSACGSSSPHNSTKNLRFLSSLRELSLHGCKLLWRDMKTLGSLPCLQILNFSGSKSLVGSKWDSSEERFLSLKHLQVYGCDGLICWIAECSHFLVLETLSLSGLSELEEIPLGVGEIATLERIGVSYCEESVYISAIKIVEEQESLGNHGLQVELNFFDQEYAKEFKEKFRLEGFPNQNLRFTYTAR